MIGTVRWACLTTLLVPALALAQASDPESRPLRFEEVAESVTAHDPRIRQSIEQLRAAEGETMVARGAFDPKLNAEGYLLTGGYYDLRVLSSELRQPTTLWGSEVYFGYRIGRGDNQRWPTYRDDQTLSGGELRAGVEVPIWRGGLIDDERAQRARALNFQEAAEYSLDALGLNLELAAAAAYWTWVSTGLNREVAKDLMLLAEERDSQLRRRLAAGSIAEFDVLDNERILIERQSLLVAAERAFQEAAFDLSLFLRDAEGQSVLPGAERLPDSVSIEPLQSLSEDAAIERVLQCHPDLNEARAELTALEINQRLFRNQLAPELRAYFEYSRDIGELTGTDLDFTLPGNVYEAGAYLSMPLLFREDRGRAQAANAKVAEQRAELQFLEDRLRAATLDAASALRAAQERAELAEGLVETATALAEGERRRFEVGSSNLVFVNLREQQAASARIRLVEATASAEIEKTRWETTTEVFCR